MWQEWSPEDVMACWTLVDGDWDLVASKTGPTRLGFALTLKFFELEGRFPEFVEEIPWDAVNNRVLITDTFNNRAVAVATDGTVTTSSRPPGQIGAVPRCP